MLWYLVLMLAPLARSWLLDNSSVRYLHLAGLLLAGLLVAHFFRAFILSADSFTDRLWRSVVMPLFGTLVYLTLFGTSILIEQFRLAGSINLHDSLAFFVWGLVAFCLAFYVVLPYGYLCQIVLEWAADRDTD